MPTDIKKVVELENYNSVKIFFRQESSIDAKSRKKGIMGNSILVWSQSISLMSIYQLQRKKNNYIHSAEI